MSRKALHVVFEKGKGATVAMRSVDALLATLPRGPLRARLIEGEIEADAQRVRMREAKREQRAEGKARRAALRWRDEQEQC